MKAVIFGASGQDGRYLTAECQKKGIIVIPISRSISGRKGDISKYDNVINIIEKTTPDYVFHLAANSTTAHNMLFENHETISTGTLNILEAVKKKSPTSKVFITGSGVQFKNSGQKISEDTDFKASSPYSVARIHSVYAARYYRSLGIKVYIGYLFNHESPYRALNCVSQKVVHAVKKIALGFPEKIEIGNIYVEKEWAFAGDIVRGILTLMEQDQIMEAVIGTGIGHSIKDWLKICFNLINKNGKEYIEEKKDFQAEYMRLVSRPDRILSLGWKPEVDIHKLAKLMVDSENAQEVRPQINC
jgi:GDPmannose 4,6-dehydratase